MRFDGEACEATVGQILVAAEVYFHCAPGTVACLVQMNEQYPKESHFIILTLSDS